ncbi:MAG TPA: hypothetical protein VK034_02355, partial [Enhygromyxa sp.]|nr:hypothetical protein [Enhygromyxa sp.]
VVTVAIPAEVLEFADDPHAGPLLAAALTELAERPALLGNERVQLELLDERFELHRYSEGMGETERVGLSIRTARTELVAADFAKALGLGDAAHQRIAITDQNPERLASAGATPFVWQGLQLEVELDERDTAGLGLHRWLVREVLVLPAAGSEPVAGDRITVTAEQASAAGLPGLGFSLDTTGTGMSGTRLGDGRYLHLSGPPGGPLSLELSPTTIDAELAELIEAPGAKLVEQQVELLGAPRRAVAWITGEGFARTSWCAVILGSSAAKPGDPALLLEVGVGHGGDAVACSTAIEDPNLAPVIGSLKLAP